MDRHYRLLSAVRSQAPTDRQNHPVTVHAVFVFTCSHPVNTSTTSFTRSGSGVMQNGKNNGRGGRQKAKGKRRKACSSSLTMCALLSTWGCPVDGLSLLMASSEISSNSPQFWSVVLHASRSGKSLGLSPTQGSDPLYVDVDA